MGLDFEIFWKNSPIMRAHNSDHGEATMQITVRIKNVYGEDKAYPVCPHAKTFAEIAGTRTLTPETLHRIKRLGVEITVEQENKLAALIG